MPALIKVIELETGCINKYFHMQKIVKTGVILWENASVQSQIFNPKGSIFRLIFRGQDNGL